MSTLDGTPYVEQDAIAVDHTAPHRFSGGLDVSGNLVTPVVTALPTAPSEGQAVYYQSTPGTVWTMKYISGSWVTVGLPGVAKIDGDPNGGVPIPNTNTFVRMKRAGGSPDASFTITTGPRSEIWEMWGIAVVRADSANDSVAQAQIINHLGGLVARGHAQRLYYNIAVPTQAGWTSVVCRNQTTIAANSSLTFYFEMATIFGSFGLQGYEGGFSHNNFQARPVMLGP